MTDEDDQSLRDALEERWDAEQEDAPDTVGETEEPIGQDRDEHGRFKARAAIGDDAEGEPGEGDDEAAVRAQEPEPAVEPGAEEAQVEAEPAQEAIPAPQSWKPAAREHWNTLPPEVQEEVNRREHGMQQYLNQTAEERKLAQSFQQVYAPYEAIIRGEGAEPLQAVETLFQTAYQLRHADANSKAMLMADMVQRYGTGMHGEQFLHALDRALTGHVTGQPQQQMPQQQPPYDPRVDNILAALEGVQHQNMSARQQAAQQQIEQFSSQAEFLDDVRDHMADLMEVAKKRGVDLTLQDAYNQACNLNPDVRAVLDRREKAKAASQAQERASKAKRAASSVGGAPTKAPRKDANEMSIRDALANAFEQHAGG